MARGQPERPSTRTPAGAQPREESELRYLASLAELVTELSGRIANSEAGRLDTEIHHVLRVIGEFAQVDRSYVFQFTKDGTRISNTHEWCAHGIEPEIDSIQDTPVEVFGWAFVPIQRGETVYVANTAELPADASNFRRELERQHIQSMLAVPLQCAGKVLGLVGFDAVRGTKAWGPRHINLLRVVGEIMAGAVEREAANAALRHQVELETLVANVSSRFIHVPFSTLEQEMTEAIGAIGAFTGVDRSYVFQFSAGGDRMTNTHEWCAPGIEPYIDSLRDVPVASFAYSMASMKNGEAFYVSDVSKLPPEAESEKAEFAKEGIRTLINVPIMIRGRMRGFLGFDAVRARKVWSADDTRLLKLVAEIFANALARKWSSAKLEASLEEKEVLLREIHHRVKNNLQIIDSLLYLQMRSIRDSVEPRALDAFRRSQDRIRAMASIHEQLYRSRDLDRLGFSNYLAQLVPGLEASYALDSDVEITICGCNATLGVDQAVPCGLIVNELVTNALKHAFPDRRPGRIDICLEQTGHTSYALSVTDNGVGFSSGDPWSRTRSLGLRLVKDLAQQLGGTAELESTTSGSRVAVRF